VATVKLENVWKQFGSATAVRDLNLEVREGEFLALLGPSGCGKTTTLRMIGGLETPSYGRILFDDQDVTLWSPGKRDIAMVFQSYALYPHMTIYGNLAFGPKIRHDNKADLTRRVDEVAEVLGIKHLLKRRPGQLSGGQRQRVALGRALLRHPRLFLLDEPLSNLDASLRVQMRTELVRLHNSLGVTTAYVTHDQVEAMTMGHRIAVFDHGELLQIGPPNELYDHPVNAFVAEFIGSPKINFFPGELAGVERNQVSVQTLGQAISLNGTSRDSAGGTKLKVGVRPHDIHLSATLNDDSAVRVRGVLDAVEHTGSEIFAELVTESGSHLMARLDRAAPVAVGDNIEVAFLPSRLHLFDEASDEPVLHKAPQSASAISAPKPAETTSQT
jgi:multiple sugar transport system ATP-binding protein